MGSTCGGLAGAGYQQVSAAGNGNNAEDGRDGNGVLAVGFRMDGADVEDGVAVGVSDALVNQGGDAEDDQEYSEESSGFHNTQIFGAWGENGLILKCAIAQMERN